ncbi:MAG: aminotransferase class IV [Planctomycetaceae bacterium]|jgi:branched-chain amino acid aminotransferase|nr:aminotransferase class IV [Planctomycetaceae bacterium]MDG2388845.1 aminotransferase class IV [Planctomycetaceae bacterium]
MTQMTAWINGEFLPFSAVSLSLADSGIVHGDAVTEMLRTFGHKPFRISDHLDRFRHSLNESLLKCAYSDEDLESVINEVISRSTVESDVSQDLGIILFATSGPNVTYLGKGGDHLPTVCVHSFPLHFSLWRNCLEFGQSLIVSKQPAIPADSFDPTIKSRSRMHWRIADREVKQSHPSATAVFADSSENVTETSSGNLFAVIGEEVITPPDSTVLNGISRQVVIELAEQLGYRVKKELLSVQQASEATEIWISSTPYCLLPVTSFNDQPVGDGQPGPLFHQLLHAWSQSVGIDIQEQILSSP